MGWGEAFGEEIIFSSVILVSGCIGTVIFSEPAEDPERERGQSGVCSGLGYGYRTEMETVIEAVLWTTVLKGTEG